MAKTQQEANNTPEKKPSRKAAVGKAAKTSPASDAKTVDPAPRKRAAKSAKGASSGASTKTKKTAADKVGSTAAITALATRNAAEQSAAIEPKPAKTEAASRKKGRTAPVDQEAGYSSSPAMESRQTAERGEPSGSDRPRGQEHSGGDQTDHAVLAQPTIMEPPGGDHAGQGKRKRRRNKQRNGNQNERQQPHVSETFSRDLNQKKLAKKAWEIFAAEVAEEGIALMDDNTSREVARRSFRLAEFFMLEEAKRRQPAKHKNQPEERDGFSEIGGEKN